MADVRCPLGMFLDAAASAIARMDFEVESHDLRGAADHRTRCLALDDAAGIRQLAAGVREACRPLGREGVSTWAMVSDTTRLLADTIESTGRGGGEPWLRDRDRVRELLDELRAASRQDEPPDEDRDVVVRSAVLPAASSRPTPARTAAIGSDAQARAREKGDKAKRSPRRRRPGTGNPPGRPSKDTDDLLRKVIRQIADESRREKIDVERELHDRVYERTADELCELILERLRKKVAPSTLRSSSKLWRTWSIFRDRRGKPTGTTAEDVPVEYGSLRVGGVKKTIEERRQDAELARYGITLDDD
jgi:hypothetical protein